MKICFHILIVFIQIGCTHQKSGLNEIIVDSKNLSDFNISEIADSVIAISLETGGSSLLSFIRRVKFSDDFIYVADTRSLYRFDYNGSFINHVVKTGRGPGEIIAFYDFFIEQDSGIVDVLANRKIIRLDSDGRLKQEIPITGFPEQIQKIDSSFLIHSCDFGIQFDDGKHNVSKIVRYDIDFNAQDTLIIRDIPSLAAFADPVSDFYSHSNNDTYFYYPSSLIEPITRDTLFRVEHTKIKPAYKLRFDEHLYELNQTQRFDREKPPFKKFLINSIFVSSSFLFSSYSVERNEYFFCFDIKNNKSYNMSKGFNDDFYNTGYIQLKQFNFETNMAFFVKEGNEAAGKVKGIDEYSNPVLFIVYLKE